MYTAYASELEQNTLSSVCPVLATVVHNFFVFYLGLLLIFEQAWEAISLITTRPSIHFQFISL